MTERGEPPKHDEAKGAHTGHRDATREGKPASQHAGHAAATHDNQHSGSSEHARNGGQHGNALPPAFAPTRTQIAAVASFATILLVGGFAYPFMKVNMYLSAHDVGGAIMAPGMIMDFDTPGDAMRDMAAVDPRLTVFEAAPDARGGQLLEPRIED
ncbi:copper oxidase, partial [Mesorhizobium sp. M7A.T.Ca.TU.009.01.3.1]